MCTRTQISLTVDAMSGTKFRVGNKGKHGLCFSWGFRALLVLNHEHIVILEYPPPAAPNPALLEN